MNVLAVGAHPDDIEFGCGGSLIKYALKKSNVFLLVLTDGRWGAPKKIREKEQQEAAKFIGAKGLFWAGYKDTELICNRDLIVKIEKVVKKVNPDVVFINFWADTHQDHRAAAQATISATRYVKEVLFYEVPTTQHFEPDVFVDIEDVLDKKLKLLKIHASQVDKTRVKDLTILESATSCAYFRGYQARIKFAEGFKAVRLLRKI